MNGKFTHYLVTRFNVNIRGNGPEYIESGSRGAQWEEERLPLFETICTSSVQGQTSRDFTWLIYCDTHTSDDIIRQIKSITSQLPNVEVHLVDGFDEMVSHLRTRCSDSPTPFVITSRLDNDDAIGIQYIETIQRNFSSQEMVINLLGGINYHVSRKLMTHLRHKEHNHFSSVVEKIQDNVPLRTIMGFSHLHPPELVVVKNVFLKYAFWITLHPQNAAPRNNRGWPVMRPVVAKKYSIDPYHTPVSWRNTILYTIGWIPQAVYRKLRFKIRQLIKTKAHRG